MTDKKIYAILDRVEAQELCDLYNALNTMLDDVGEMLDVNLSDLRKLRTHSYELKSSLDLRFQKDPEGSGSCPWFPCVLPDDDRAWVRKDDG